MPSLKKNTIALTFKFDCDRFLRFSLASKDERAALGVKISSASYRPGIDLVKAAGRRWEADKFQDLVDVLPKGRTLYDRDDDEDDKVGRRLFNKVENIIDVLKTGEPPYAIIEGQFDAPSTITPALEEAYKKYGLEKVSARPDILWIRPYPTGAPLIGGPKESLKHEIHIIDVKLAAEPSLRHFTEVTYYALALAAELKEKGLSDRYAVSARGFVWPGSHDNNAFRNLYKEFSARGSEDPVADALEHTLIAVPYEVYHAHVKQFFEDRLLRVLGQAPEEAAWHVAPKCQLCEFLPYCEKQAEETDHLSRIAWLTGGQAKLLRESGINTTEELAEAIRENAPGWQRAVRTSYQLKSEASVLRARAEALQKGEFVAVPDRVSALMPRWSDVNLYLTVHFDMGSGISFAMSAMRVFFEPGAEKGSSPRRDTRTFIVDNVRDLSTDSEKKRFIEFVELLTRWMQEVSAYNASVPKEERRSVHIFFWDSLEVKQIGRMFRRHIEDPEVVEKAELLLRFFPPDNHLPDPEVFKSQPGTIVKEVCRTMFGFPIPHDYTLIEVANSLHPWIKEDGTPFKYSIPYGFKYPMTDQIPFERAYELWQDNVYLTHFNEEKYTRGEILDGIKSAAETRLSALEHIVLAMRKHHGSSLVLRKSAFSAAGPTQTKIPEKARGLIAFSKLNAAVEELQNRQDRALPVEEREARFISIRGLVPAGGESYEKAVSDVRGAKPRYAVRQLLPMIFSPNSRDSRIKEGDWLLDLSNEDSTFDVAVPWKKHLDLSFDEALELLIEHGIEDNKKANIKLSKLLQVEIALLNSTADPPFLVLSPVDTSLFRFAQSVGLLDVRRPMILDPIYEDFSTDRIVKVLRTIGGEYPKIKMRRKK
ncbi:MAG TPA: hypothetical protein VF297_18285 [Pyrinomonadaceae bacterium]